ncbi:MAG: hypothetical protein R6U10_06225 [Thermoplasmatota archaeon]
MAELKVDIPEELEDEMKKISEVSVSVAVTKLLRSELERLACLKRVQAKSELTEEDVAEISQKIDKAVARRFKASME